MKSIHENCILLESILSKFPNCILWKIFQSFNDIKTILILQATQAKTVGQIQFIAHCLGTTA